MEAANLQLRTFSRFCLVILATVCGNLASSFAQSIDSPQAMAEQIDLRIGERLKKDGFSPASPADDFAFARRVYLDLTGRNPTPGEVLQFTSDPSPERHSKLVRKLIQSGRFAARLSNIWTDMLLPEGQQIELAPSRQAVTQWLKERFENNTRYDRLVGDLLVAEGSPRQGPVLFYTALELQPEKIAARTSRAFLGLQLDCAECHDHPFDQWKQRDFWKFAAYFAQLRTDGEMMAQRQGASLSDGNEGDVNLPGTAEVIAPSPLFGITGSSISSGTRRQQLAVWFTSKDNPYLARAAVNRVWWVLMGRGLVEPVDDMSPHQVPSHPELLDELTKFFISTRFDLRQLTEAIALSKTYGQSSTPTNKDATPDLYASMPTKPLSSRQVIDTLQGMSRSLAASPEQETAVLSMLVSQIGELRGENNHYSAGIIQALQTLHGPEFNAATVEDSSRLLKANTAPFLSVEDQAQSLFLATLARKPTDSELSVVLEQAKAEQGDAKSNEWQSDLLWALINSTEFAMTP